MNGRYFLFHVGMGFDAAVVAQVERRAHLKRYAGHPLFVYAAFDTWFRHYDRTTGPGSRSATATGRSSTTATFAICFNTRPYTYLGNRPLDVAPDATLDRGLVGAGDAADDGAEHPAAGRSGAVEGRSAGLEAALVDYRTASPR